ncbi:MAG: extracellular solute-binding protein [Chloroflexi bacterium]|nr:extracellular solute-binding protein [Chloroflexota bacterium]
MSLDKSLRILGITVMLGVLASACSAPPGSTPPVTAPTRPAAQTGWQIEWEKTVAAAKKEGKLVLYITSGADMQALLRKSLKEKFGLEIEYVSGTGSELANKVVAEKKAGLHLGDLYIGGAGTPVTGLKPAGALAPLKPLLLLPEVLDARGYFDNELPFVDIEQMYVFCYGLNVANTLAVNSDLVRAGDLRGYAALLEPRWKEKIIMYDPTVGGTGQEWFYVTAYDSMSLDFHRQLARQIPLITRDKRLPVDWVARGKYLVAVAPSKAQVSEFQQIGAPVQWVTPAEGRYLSGTDAVAYLDKAPHPNAARVFLNWLLSRDGMTAWSQSTLMQSARKDVATGFLAPETIREPNARYFNTVREEVRLKMSDASKVAKEIYGGLLK